MAAIAITGATGFLGGVLARRLLALGQPVIAMGRDREKLAALEKLGARVLPCDLSLGAPPADGLEADALVHSAALSSAWGRTGDFRAANVTGTQSAVVLARSIGARRLVHISTPSLYFRFRDQPRVREDAALPAPVNAYAATKREAEQLALTASDLDPVILRPRGIYGAGDTALLPRLLRAARSGPLPLVRDGAAETDLTHVDDVAAAILAALAAPPAPASRIFNISGGEPLPIRRIAEAAAARAGASVRWRSIPEVALLAAARTLELAACLHPARPEPRITAYSAGLFAFTQTLDLSAARAHLGWTPQISFGEGLARTFGDGT
ncbi:NAD-dependent epimerase/dehydratase family protein [Hyphomonas sp.]|uniref:NAD-dependent epimerase/dehydratase family protein n=1 Tax=Hyphomonas sp. TaxID=87 RepID=UPI00391890D3